MIVVMSTGKNVSGAVYYNEEKVNHGEAQLLKAANFASESLALQSEGYRRHVLEAYADKNVKIGKPCVHFALSFSPSENLPDSLIGQIGTDFMEQMGFADQPYLQYRHHDTHHPHIHIVSVLVDGEGQKVSERFSKSRCNEARKALELKYNLVQAEKQGKTVLMDGLLPEQILSFKEPEAKKAIGNVVRTAMTDYHFSSLISFSDFLHQHKIQLNVHQGQTKGGTPFRGLSFQLTNGDADRRGQAIGPAIKASSFGFAPTMDRLEDRFRVGTHQVAAGQRATLERIGVALREFSSISEADFKGQLRAQGVQVIDTGKQYVYVDHKSRNVYSEAELGPQFNYQRQQAAFTQRSERIPVPIPVPKPIIAPILKPAIAPKPPVEVKPQAQPKPLTPAPVIPPATPNPEHELAHRRRVSHHYQLARTKGVEGKPAPFFESQLIRQFPHQHLTQALLSEGIPRLDAQRAVSQFEAYKQGQLMEIKAKEESYFIQTATLLGKLAAQMPIAGESKAKFLQSMGLELSALGLIHQQDKYLRLPLTLTQLMELQADRGPRLVFREKATKHERNLYLAIADGQPVPAGVSFYQVSASQLKFSIGQERFAQLAPTLNGQFLEQVTTHLAEKREGWPQLAERGLLVERGAGNTLRVGHYFTDPSQFVALPKALADRLAGEAIPSMENQRQALQSGVGRNLMSLTQALDQGDTQRVAQMVATYARDKARSKSGSTIHTAESVRKELQERFLKLYETKPVSQTTARPTTTVQPAPTVQPVPTVKPAPNVPHSLYGERVVSLLLQASVSPVQRGELAQQLGLNWHVGREGSLRLIEGKSSPQPGASYLLSSQQQALLVKPEGGSNPPILLQSADRQVLGTYLAGQPLSASGLAPQQFARLNMPVLEKLLPASTHGSLHQWYHTQRGAQIIVDTSAQVGDASARRYLSNLYQRGFLVRQIAGSAGQAPQYRMGHFQADPATYVPVPALLSAKLTDAYPALTKGSGYLVEPAWPAPRSAQANNMMRLAAAIDSEHKPSAIAQQVGRLQQVYSGLRPLNQPKDLLDALVSGTELRQSTVNSSSKASERPQQAGKSSSERDIETDSLLDMLDRQTGQCNQKGFLDVLGESADVVRPKKKRIGQDDRHRSRLK